MNVFLLSLNPKENVKYYCDKHVVKMIVESTQLLCASSFRSYSNISIFDTKDEKDMRLWNEWNISNNFMGYLPSHLKHPCTLWLIESLDNWLYLKDLAYCLINEWCYRYRHSPLEHPCKKVLDNLAEPKLPALGLTEPPQCMPEKYKISNDVIMAYRNYYIGEKWKFVKWTKRGIPDWWYFINK